MKFAILNASQKTMRRYALSQIDLLPSFSALLELGCNDGSSAAYHFSQSSIASRYTGIDIRKDKIKQAKKSYPDLLFKRMDVLTKSALELIAKADVFMSFETLEHIGTPRGDEDVKVLSWLTPGAMVFISVPNFNAVRHVRHYNLDGWWVRYKSVIEMKEIRVYKSIHPKGKKRGNHTYLFIGFRK